MKRNDTSDMCVLYIEPTDTRDEIARVIAGQHKPVALILDKQAQVFRRPDDFLTFKHLKRQLDTTFLFVIAHSERLATLAGRNGFPVYASLDALSDAFAAARMSQSGARRRTTDLLEMQGAQRRSSGLNDSAQTDQYMVDDRAWQSGQLSQPLTRFEQNAIRQSRRTVPFLPLRERVAHVPLLRGGKKQKTFNVIVAVLVCLALVGTGLGSFLVVFRTPTSFAPPPLSVGHMYFLSSEQLSENSNQGENDQVQINLTTIPAPMPHKNYYAWLLSDKNQGDPKAIFLGALQLNRGNGHLFYAGDQQHTNLLAMDSRFLVTEEDATVPPIAPSPDESTWRFSGSISQTPILATDPHHYSELDHVRHLLADDPTLDELESPGGLNTWFFRNMGKIIEWTTSMREHYEEDQGDIAFIRRQSIRTLAYLDGLSYVRMDVPNDTPLGVNERLARVGLLNVAGPNQDPPSYLDHIAHHLNGLLQASTMERPLRQKVAALITALTSVQTFLLKVRQDALQLARMGDAQLAQAGTLSLLNDIIAQATNAYVGQSDPATGQMREGTVWVHDHLQALATLSVFVLASTAKAELV